MAGMRRHLGHPRPAMAAGALTEGSDTGWQAW